MQNYYVTPVRYTVAAGDGDSEQWGARLAAFLYVSFGVLILASLLLNSIGPAVDPVLAVIQPFLGAVGLTTLVRGTPGLTTMLLVGGAFLGVGVGILREWEWAYWAGMGLAVVLFLPAPWAGTLVGLALLIALWRGKEAFRNPGRAT